MANTGKKRSLTVVINKNVNGVSVPGYPKIYSGRNEFSVNGDVYQQISKQQMGSMPLPQYLNRLNAFQAWVEAQETGLDFEVNVVPGQEAYKDDEGMCPLGE